MNNDVILLLQEAAEDISSPMLLLRATLLAKKVWLSFYAMIEIFLEFPKMIS